MKEILYNVWLGVKGAASVIAYIFSWLFLGVTCLTLVVKIVLKGIILTIDAVLDGGRTRYRVKEYINSVEKKLVEICKL